MKNNLFYYATKELSQDAFICWLCSFALEDANKDDEELVKCAKTIICEFMKRGLEKTDISANDINLMEVARQQNNIDVLLTVTYLGLTYKIIIEDKTHTSEHDDQLIRYKKSIEDSCNQVIGIYYKTGFQSNYKNVEKAGYVIFDRKDIINLLKNCKSGNNILKDYRDYWEEFENFSLSYQTKSFSEWSDWQQVNGFYDEIQNILVDEGFWASYGYVSNKSGGFWGFWYGPDEDTVISGMFKGVLYLQTEIKWNNEEKKYDIRICTKLEEQSEEKSDEKLSRLRDIIVANQEEYGFLKPKYLRWGAHMTLGEYQFEKRNIDANGIKDAMFSSLKAYRELIEKVKFEFAK